MTIRRTMKVRKALAVVAITTGLGLSVAACGSGGGEEDKKQDGQSPTASADKGGGPDDGKSDDDKILAQVKGGKNITLTITSAKREQGGFLTVEGTITNGGNAPWNAPYWQGDEVELKDNGASMAGANLMAQKEKKRYLVLRDTEGRCLCTKFTQGLSPGETVSWFAQFPAPEPSTTEVDFQIADMPAAKIKITEG